MKNSVLMAIVVGCWLSLGLTDPPPAEAQGLIKRLQQRVRERLEQPEANKETDPGKTPTEAVPPQRGDADEPAAKKEPGYLGIVGDDQQDRGQGVRILEVRPGSPAEKAGLQPQDLITGVSGNSVQKMTDLAEILGLFSAGQSPRFEILRGDQSQQVEVTLGRESETAVPAEQQPTTAETVAEGPTAETPSPAGPELQPPMPEGDSTQFEQLLRRIEQLERRVAELERALAESSSGR